MATVRGTTRHAETVYYTGRAGDGWVSKDPREAFTYSLEGATAKAAQFNAWTSVHGITFEPA